METETKSRYTTEELLTKSLLLRTISERVIDRELTLLSSLLDPILEESNEIRLIAEKIAQIDLESAFALLALRQSYSRPIITKGESVEIIDGRHPVLDKLFSSDPDLLRQFTPNSLNLSNNRIKYYFLLLSLIHSLFR